MSYIYDVVVPPIQAAFQFTLETIDDIVNELVEDLIVFVLSFFLLFEEIFISFWSILYLLIIGFALVFARYRFIASAEALANNFGPIADILNGVIGTIDGLVGAVAAIGGAVVDLFGEVFSDDDPAKCLGCYFQTIPFINTTAAEDWLRSVPEQCEPFNSADKILDGLIRSNASPSICPTMRRLYVIDWMYPWLWPIVDALWLSYDPTPLYSGNENNCAGPDITPRWECLILGLGYVLLEVLLPLLLIGIMWRAGGRELASVVYDLLRSAFRLVVTALTLAAGALYRILGS